MKKTLFLLMSVLVLTGCEIEDDGPTTVNVLAEVVDADLPETFEMGETYEIDITYLLPDACHLPMGLQASRGAMNGDARRDIYIAGVASRKADQNECTLEDEDLEEVEELTIRIDEDEAYTFYLWTGFDEDDESVYTKIVVPVEEDTPASATK